MTRLRAKIETEVSSLATRSIEEGADDRQAADQRRQQRRDQAAEEEQREQEQEREGEHLGAAQVGLDLLVHLLLGERGAAEGDARERRRRRSAIRLAASWRSLSSVGFRSTAR